MAMSITKEELIEHLNRYYAEETLLVVQLWSSQDVEVMMSEPDEDKAMDIWADIAETFSNAFDYSTGVLNDTLYELVQDEEND
jgi:hypothetical protein